MFSKYNPRNHIQYCTDVFLPLPGISQTPAAVLHCRDPRNPVITPRDFEITACAVVLVTTQLSPGLRRGTWRLSLVERGLLRSSPLTNCVNFGFIMTYCNDYW